MSALLLADELPQDVAGAEAVLGSHKEHKGEIDARQASFTAFKANGKELVAAKHYASNEVHTYTCMVVFMDIRSAGTSYSLS
jgi:hypothetical protein